MAYRISLIAYRKKQIWLLVIGYWLLVSLSGCATIVEDAKGIVGVSTKALEDGRKDAIKKTFNDGYDTCYNKIKKTLNRIGAYIYAQDAKKKMIAIYVSATDTTAVGIFFKEIDAYNTEVEVSSPSTYAKEFIAAKLFKSPVLKEILEETDVQKKMPFK